jgi:hypothetical protein
MRKFYTVILLITCAVFTLQAQPTLNHPGNTPQIGDQIFLQYVDHNGLAPGASGAGVSWDFGTLTNADLLMVEVVDPTLTPYSGDFPDADMAFSTGGIAFSYNTADNSGMYLLGFGADTGGVVILNVYTNYETMITYPFTYNSSFSDEYKGGFSSMGVQIRQSGTVTTTGDAYGTITLPTGTFNNVLRTKTERMQVDSMFLGAKFLQATVNNDILYNWYTANGTTPIFSLTTDESGTPTSANYGDEATGLEEGQESISNMQVYPNPATDNLTVSFKNTSLSVVTISLVNQLGQSVLSVTNKYGQSGTRTEKLDISNIPSGIYYVQIGTGNKEVMTQKILIN